MMEHIWNNLRFFCYKLKLEKNNLEEFVRYGIKRAKNYNLNTEQEVKQYLECMITIDAEFDKNKETLWASEVLNDTDLE